uniref:Calpain catalytic domain-containing protein n=1 Tax=Acrobeloides nanus TaxID=290746 RepID=A0A914DKZ5_9BILA
MLKKSWQTLRNLKKSEQNKGLLFEDPDFSPEDALPNANSDIKWLRPHEIVSNPEFFTDGQSRFDVVQGAIADCWLLAAVATISMCDGLFFRVVPPDQGFSKKESYAGVFYFHFWRYGEWIEVVVDDRLPTYNKSLILMHSKDGNEFWSALLEKAYAKIYGSYNAIQFGYTSEAIQDMSGGLTEYFELDNPPPNLLEMIIRGLNKNSIFGCSYNKEMPSEVIECPEEEIKEMPLKLCEGPLEDTKKESILTDDNKEEYKPGNDVKEEARPLGKVKEESRTVENVKEESEPTKNVKEESGPAKNVKEESSPTEDVKDDFRPVEKVKEESIPTENAKEESTEVTICHTESVRTDGIVMQHAYSINGVCKIKTKEKTVALLRLRNPWGKMEWNQAWSDGSKEWDLVSPEVREKIKLNFDEDGEFWMELGDFMAKFCYLDVCHLDPLLITDVSFESTNSQVNWMMSTYHGTLKQQSPDDKEFQDEYRFKLDDLVPGEDLTIVIAVMQKYRRENSLAMMGLAFAVCEGTCSLKVSPGEYSIVSVAYSEIDFMIRVYTNGFICSEQGSVSEVESRDKIFC